MHIMFLCIQGRIQEGGGGGGGGEGARGAKIGKNMIFWRKIVSFHTKYPKNVRASLRSAHFFFSAPPPPPPPTRNPGSAPGIIIYSEP